MGRRRTACPGPRRRGELRRDWPGHCRPAGPPRTAAATSAGRAARRPIGDDHGRGERVGAVAVPAVRARPPTNVRRTPSNTSRRSPPSWTTLKVASRSWSLEPRNSDLATDGSIEETACGSSRHGRPKRFAGGVQASRPGIACDGRFEPPPLPAASRFTAAFGRRIGLSGWRQAQLFCGKPRSRPRWLGSSQRVVMTLLRVK